MYRAWRVILLMAVALVNAALLMNVSTVLICILIGDEDSPWTSGLEGLVEAWQGEMLDDAFWMGCCFVPAIVVSVTQLIFVLPLLGSRPVISAHGKPLWSTVVMAALVAGALFVGLLFAVAEACGLFESMVELVFNDSVQDSLPLRLGDWLSTLWVWAYLVPGWIMWSFILMTFARRNPGRTRWGCWVGLLLGGTVLETLIVVPIDIMVRRRTECYCGTGSFYALLISMWALLWLTGPGIVIAATSRRRRLWSETRCDACGHEKGPSPGVRCPECGCVWAA